MMDVSLTTLLGSAVVSAFVSGWVSWANAERKIFAENITKERAKWRERIRFIAAEYPSSENERKGVLERELLSRLNPYDSEDLKLLESLKRSTEMDHQELAVRVSLLLKHDWERAKDEAKPFWLRRVNAVKRISFEEYMSCHEKYRNGDLSGFCTAVRRLTAEEPWM